jgi:hypothetical protein
MRAANILHIRKAFNKTRKIRGSQRLVELIRLVVSFPIRRDDSGSVPHFYPGIAVSDPLGWARLLFRAPSVPGSPCFGQIGCRNLHVGKPESNLVFPALGLDPSALVRHSLSASCPAVERHGSV